MVELQVYDYCKKNIYIYAVHIYVWFFFKISESDCIILRIAMYVQWISDCYF